MHFASQNQCGEMLEVFCCSLAMSIYRLYCLFASYGRQAAEGVLAVRIRTKIAGLSAFRC